MRIHDGQIQLSASDLANHLVCGHLSSLDLRCTHGKIKRPFWHDPGVAVLIERGYRHESAYLTHLEQDDLRVQRYGHDMFDEEGRWAESAMKSGAAVIAQADLQHGRWHGRADVLLRVDQPSKLGDWSYEVVDTKLALETKGGTILQLCLYSALIEEIQGRMPEFMHVVTPANNFQRESFRLHDYLAYYRFVKSRLENTVALDPIPDTYPEPVDHCVICRWWSVCNDRRRNDDHLSFVAGISKLQIGELRKWGVDTLADLAVMPLPLKQRPDRGSADAYERIREQARIQLEYRSTGKPIHELLPLEEHRGFSRLPEPSQGDIFLDFEGDPFVENGGLEYLLGFVELNESGEAQYTGGWALNRDEERRTFEFFIDHVMERRSRFPDLHIYHFSHYEPTALKRLMGRYATREDEMDRMLRAKVFVDLYAIVKQSLRASVETYSLKDLEMFFKFARETTLKDARQSLRIVECALELNDAASIPEEARQTVGGYNREDCLSTLHLRNWLENLRRDLMQKGNKIERPVLESGDPSDAVDERRTRVLALMERLLHDIPADPSAQSTEQHSVWLLAHMLEWHRREAKTAWWEYYRLKDLSDEERMYERYAISGLQFVKRIEGGTARCPIERYRFPLQDTDVRKGDDLETSDGKFGTIVEMDGLTMEVKKTGAMAEVHPVSVFAYTRIDAREQPESLFRLGTRVANHGIDETGSETKYRAARDLLLRKQPRRIVGSSSELYNLDADVVAEARRLALELDHGVLPVQGPPGAGKTYLGARMICTLLRDHKKVGITAVSHKVIRKLLEEVLNAAIAEKLKVCCIAKVTEKSVAANPAIPETTDNEDVLAALQNGDAQVAAGTAWLWSRADFEESVDVLFVDEAGQMSLADVLAVSQAAKSVVLLGDPQQLEQPLQGTHPPGVAVSALQHILGTHPTMPDDLGIFLKETWRLAPAICRFTSELFYDGRLKPHKGLEQQQLLSPTQIAGSGLWFAPVVHEGNQNSSNEEADVVQRIVRDLLNTGSSWRDFKGNVRALGLGDILIVAPYNAHVFKLMERLPGARIGTVDKFQGQEAPVVIYSMATSSPEEAPHGMEFLYSLNRFNVATSRARCVCILVASPRLLEPECKTPRQMKLANVLCRYRELAQVWNVKQPR